MIMRGEITYERTGGEGMSGRTPITPWSADTGVSGEPLAAAPAVQALQPLIDGASMASSPELHMLFGALAAAQGAMQNAEKNQQAKVGQSGTRMYADLAAVLTAVREAARRRSWPSCSFRSWTCRYHRRDSPSPRCWVTRRVSGSASGWMPKRPPWPA